jgi:hypothetical protein
MVFLTSLECAMMQGNVNAVCYLLSKWSVRRYKLEKCDTIGHGLLCQNNQRQVLQECLDDGRVLIHFFSDFGEDQLEERMNIVELDNYPDQLDIECKAWIAMNTCSLL